MNDYRKLIENLRAEALNIRQTGFYCFATDDDCENAANAIEQLVAERDASIALPCKVGDTVYSISNGEIHEFEVVQVAALISSSVNAITVHVKNSRGAIITLHVPSLGETAFLTREEAVEVLKRRAGE